MYTVPLRVSHFTLKEQLKIQRANPKENYSGNKIKLRVSFEIQSLELLEESQVTRT